MGTAAAAMALRIPVETVPSSTHGRRCYGSSSRRSIVGGESESFINLHFCRQNIIGFNNLKSKQPPNSAVPVNCSSSTPGASPDENLPLSPENQVPQASSIWKKWRENSAELSAKMAKLGLAAVLAYGLFDGVTYTTFFVLAFLGYEKSTGKNPAANLQALLGIVILMWTGNNITRPFRVAGAAALAPAIDKGLRRIQQHLNLPSLVYAFALVVGIVAASCLTVVGLLILSRWGK